MQSVGTFKRFFTIVLTVALFLTFCLHAIQAKHTHFAIPHSEGTHHEDDHGHGMTLNDLDVVMHLSDKKLFLLVLVALLVCIPTLQLKRIVYSLMLCAHRNSAHVFKKYSVVPRHHFYLHQFFSKGILNTKAF